MATKLSETGAAAMRAAMIDSQLRTNDVIDPDVVAVLVARATKISGPVGELTPRQLEVLGLMAEGRSNSYIAAHLGSSEKAVVHHTSNIYDAFSLPVAADDHRRVLAVVRYLAAAGDLDAGSGIR